MINIFKTIGIRRRTLSIPNSMISSIRWQSSKKASEPLKAIPSESVTSSPSATFIKKQKELKKLEDKNLPEWKKRTMAIKQRYGDWNPTRKLSREQMESVKSLKEQVPLMKAVELASHFNISPEAIRRILKSKWVPNLEQRERMERRADERKEESNAKRDAISQDITLARKRMNYGKSVELPSIISGPAERIDDKRMFKNHQMHKTMRTFTKDGKVLYDSSISHSFYKSKRRRNDNSVKREFRKRPFAESIGDLID